MSSRQKDSRQKPVGGAVGQLGVGDICGGVACGYDSNVDVETQGRQQAPASNTGPRIEGSGLSSRSWSGLDWLSFTVDGDCKHQDVMEFAPARLAVRMGPFSGRGNYTERYKLSPAGHLYHSPLDRREGYLLEFTGSDLSVLRTAGVEDEALLRWVLKHRALKNITRLDVALDLYGGDVCMSELVDAYRRDAFETRPADLSVGLYDTNRGRGGVTLYLGSRKSQRFMRIYDKAAEQGLVGHEGWTRLELQTRKRFALDTARRVVGFGPEQVVVEHLAHVLVMPGTWLQQLVVGCAGHAVQVVRSKSDRRVEWVTGVAWPAVLRYLDETGDEELLREVLSGVQGLGLRAGLFAGVA